MSRVDGWTKSEDQILVETVLKFIDSGKTQLDAFAQVASMIDRTWRAVGYRWNHDLRHLHKEEIKAAQERRMEIRRNERLYKVKNRKKILRVRGFEILEEFVPDSPILPTRQTECAAGYDFHIVDDANLLPGETYLLETGITAYMLSDEFLGIYIRSGTPYKYDVMLANGVGVIDSDYYGKPIKLMFRNIGTTPIHWKSGDRVAQGIFQKYLLADGDIPGKQRDGGFNSTGR